MIIISDVFNLLNTFMNFIKFVDTYLILFNGNFFCCLPKEEGMFFVLCPKGMVPQLNINGHLVG